ncbi:MAG: type II CRISPR RNA-guided endonuclease Cas9, partial [Clostridiales bacterium]|nr:type II CRISPR RNA-guided endonuclease Cas9 [Clostridiales bacterium]
LIEDSSQKDIRLVYLALHNIIKYRGNFLYEGQNFSEITDNIGITIQELIDNCLKYDIANIDLSPEEIKEILTIKNQSKSKKVEMLRNNNKIYKNQLSNIFNGIVGLKVDLSKIFTMKIFENNLSFKFSDEDIDEKLEEARNVLGDMYEVIETMQEIYNWVILENVLDGEKYISMAKVKGFERFNKQLSNLKDLIKNYSMSFYEEIFKNKDFDVNYESYIKNKDKAKGNNSIKELFYKKIKTFIEERLNDDYMIKEKNEIINDIDNDNFLVIQNTKDNAGIPYQLNQSELAIILDNQSKYYKSIKDNKEKIIKLLTFRVPYYVGPLNVNSKYAWLERKNGTKNQKIYPWNIDEIVDIDLTAETFIKRMTNKCSYLLKEDVLPRNSILFSEYMYYNEINKIRINNKKLSKNLKEDLKEKLFLKKKIVKEKDIIEWYKNYHQLDSSDVKVEGLQGDKQAASSFSAYIDFLKIFGEIKKENLPMIEKIIEWITIFTDKKILFRKIQVEYPDIYKNKEQINRIVKLKYTGWARLSKKLIDGIYIIDSYQNKKTILDILKDTSLNFMQIINSSKYGFDKKIKQENKTNSSIEMSYDNLISDLQGSPKIKRGVWQAIKIVEEIIKVMGAYPENIFLEVPRSDEESKTTNTRKKTMERLYKDLKDINSSYINDDSKKELKECKSINKRQLLYFMQLGKCMYSGEKLDFNSLSEYETDHIIYQSLIKDDSIDNLVLVKKKYNQERSNQKMPVNFVSNEIKTWWKYLKEKGLISSKKYNNLMKYSLNRGEEEGFINRQLVETRQITKHITNLLVNCYEKHGVNIVAIKAKLVDDFKKRYEIYKNRNINDYHHAKDAFITSVVGNYILRRFPKLEKEFIYDEYRKYADYYNKNKDEYDRKNKYGFIIGSMNRDYINEDDGIIIWNAHKSIDLIKKQLNYKDFFVTKKVSTNKDKFFNETICPKLKPNEKSDKAIPLKNNLDVYKYGHYSGELTAYSSIVEFTKKNKRQKALVSVPVRYSYIIGDSKEKLIKYFEDVVKLDNVKILKDKILKYQLIKNDNGYFYIVATTELHNAKQLILDTEAERVIYNINNNYQVTDSELIETLDKILFKINTQYPIFNNIFLKVSSNKKVFANLSLEDKKKVILELLKVTKANSQNANLTVLNNKEIVSKLSKEEKDALVKCTDREGRLNGKIINIDKTVFIYQSVTGMFTREEKY